MVNAQKVPSLRWWRIVGVCFLLYSIAFMDRINVGFGFAGMQKELGFTATFSGLVGSIFFVGYFLLQMPGGMFAQKFGARKFVLIASLVWGVLAIWTGFVHNATELLIVRFLLGVAEGGVYPALMVLITRWFPPSERGRAISYLIMCVPFGSMVMSPISGYIVTTYNWHVLFLVEGMFPFIWAIFWWLLVSDSPEEAKWLSNEERTYIQQGLAKENKQVVKHVVSFKQALTNKNVLLLVLIYFLIQIGQYGIGLWLPTVVKSLSGGSFTMVGFISAIPWAAGIVGLYINGRHSDKTGERKKHVAVALIVGGIFLLISALLGKGNPVSAIVALTLAVGFFQSYNGIIWAIPSEVVDPKILGPIAGLINGVGTLGGGFVGPLGVGYLITKTNSPLAGEVFLVIVLVLAGIIISNLHYEATPAQGAGISAK